MILNKRKNYFFLPYTPIYTALAVSTQWQFQRIWQFQGEIIKEI